MAILVVNKRQTGSGAVVSLTLPAIATKGNILVAFISQASTEVEPTLAGWTVNPTNAQTISSTSRIYVAIKEASGSEIEIKPTAGAGGAIQGISYVELSGATTEVDVIVAGSKLAKSISAEVGPITTTTVGDALLCGFARGAANFGAIKPWTGEHALTNVEEVATRCFSGYEVLTGTVTGATLAAAWTTEANPCGLAVTIKAAAAGATGLLAGTATVKTSTSAAVTGQAALSAAMKARVAATAALVAQARLSATATSRISASTALGAQARLSGSATARISATASLSSAAGATGTLSGSAVVRVGASVPLRAQAVIRATVGVRMTGVAPLGASASIAGQVKVRLTSTGSVVATGGLSAAVKTRTLPIASLAARASIAASARVVVGSSLSIASGSGSRGALIVYTTIVPAPRIPLTVTQSPRLALTVEKPKAIPHTTQVE